LTAPVSSDRHHRGETHNPLEVSRVKRKRTLAEIEAYLGRPCMHLVEYVNGRSMARSKWGDYCRRCAQTAALREYEQRSGTRLGWKARARKPTDSEVSQHD